MQRPFLDQRNQVKFDLTSLIPGLRGDITIQDSYVQATRLPCLLLVAKPLNSANVLVNNLPFVTVQRHQRCETQAKSARPKQYSHQELLLAKDHKT